MYRLRLQVVIDSTDLDETLIEAGKSVTLHPPGGSHSSMIESARPVLERLLEDVGQEARDQIDQLATALKGAEERAELDARTALAAIAGAIGQFEEDDDFSPALLYGSLVQIIATAKERGTIE